MAGLGRNSLWRQGDVLTPEGALEFDPELSDNPNDTFVVVISHDCDLAADAEKEPECEVIVGQRIKKLGTEAHAKVARRLHIEYKQGVDSVFVALNVTAKQRIPKAQLLKNGPREDMRLDGRGLEILKNWLASRYARDAFPETFEDCLRTVNLPGKGRIPERIEQILDSTKDHIKMLLFDLDEGIFQERDLSAGPYQLGISVVYESGRDESAALGVAEETAQALEELFASAFNPRGKGWQGIQLKYCDSISDNAITLAQTGLLKEWKLDHLSLQIEPPNTSLAWLR